MTTADGMDPQLPIEAVAPLSASILPPAPLAGAPESGRILNALLRGEIAAVESYHIAIQKLAEHSETAVVLGGIQREHARSIDALRERIVELGSEPMAHSGLWGIWATFAEGVATIFGESAAIQGLREGEAHGLSEYQQSVQALDVTSASLIEQRFIPAQERHLEQLDELLAME